MPLFVDETGGREPTRGFARAASGARGLSSTAVKPRADRSREETEGNRGWQRCLLWAKAFASQQLVLRQQEPRTGRVWGTPKPIDSHRKGSEMVH